MTVRNIIWALYFGYFYCRLKQQRFEEPFTFPTDQHVLNCDVLKLYIIGFAHSGKYYRSYFKSRYYGSCLKVVDTTGIVSRLDTIGPFS